MYLAIKRYRPHYECCKQLRSIEKHLVNVKPLIQKIQSDQERQTYSKQLIALNDDLSAIAVNSIIPGSDPKIMDKIIVVKQINVIREKIDELISNLEQALNEQELRLKRLQETLEQERCKQAEEDERRRQQEQKRREMNEQRELIAKQFLTENVNHHQQQQQQMTNNQQNGTVDLSSIEPSSLIIMNDEERQRQIDYLKRLEQERRDYELALRL
ncbi:hypothetical protein BLA29_009755, partial [Euroglyphus maynei]